MLSGIDILRKRQQMKLNQKKPSPFVDFDKFIQEGDLGLGAKSFVQTKGWYLYDFFDNIRSKNNNSYVTCIDELLKDGIFTNDDLHDFPVSTILHVAERKSETYNSIFSAKLANFLGIRTEYVAPHKSDDKKYISIDFLKDKETIENFYEFTGLNKDYLDVHYGMQNLLSRWLVPLDESLKHKIQHLPDKQRTRIYRDIITDFVKLYFFKKYVIMDSDLAGKNFSFVHSMPDYSDVVVAPGYDYEFSFYFPNFQLSQSEMGDDFKFLFDFNPRVFSSVQDVFNIDVSPNGENYSQIHKIFESCPDKHAEEKFNVVINNLLTMNAMLNAVKNGKDPSTSDEWWCE